MTAYLALFVLPAIWAASRRFGPATESWVLAGIALVLILFIGLRHWIGGDWHSYWLMLERARAYPLSEALTVSDPAYMAINVVAARLDLSIGAVNLACAALLVAGLVAFCRRLISPPLALWIAIPVLIAVAAMNSTRQATAVGLEMAALALLLRGGRLGRPALLLVVACAFHWSAAVLLPLIALHGYPAWRRALLAGLGIAGVAALVLVSLRQGGTANFTHMQGAAFRLAPSLGAVALLGALRDRLRYDERERTSASFLAWLTLLCALMLPLLPMEAGRLFYYTIPLQMLVLPRAIEAVPGLWARRAAVAVLAGGTAAMLVVWFALSPYSRCLAPYHSYLEQPRALIGRELPKAMCAQPSG